MKIEAHGIEITFKKDTARNEDTQIWDATILFNQHELDFEFEESLVLNNNSGETSIDKKLISAFVKHVLDNLDLIQLKGSSTLIELHKQVFKENELLRTKGYFQVGLFELKNVRNHLANSPNVLPQFEYDVYFYLESEIDLIMDPYHSYYGHFSNHNGLTITGVSRIG